MQSPILSIIVPVYNVKPYLRKCVESLLPYAPFPEGNGVGQDLDPAEYEIILVDDGSTDGSGELADELAQSPIPNHQSPIPNHKSQIIQVIHQANKGLSEARNTGIRAAQGKYVQFVDSDDYLEPNVFGELVAQMEREELDVLRFDYQNVRLVRESESESERYEVFEPNKTPRQVDHCTDIVTGEEYLNTRMGYACYASQFLIRRTLLICDAEPNAAMAETTPQPEEKMMFLPNIYLEDTEWTPRMLLAAKRVNSSAIIVYNYLSRDGSIMRDTDVKKKIKLINSLFIVNNTLLKLMQQVHNTTWLRGNRSDNAFSILKNVARYDFANRHEWLKKLHDSHVYPLCVYKCTRNTRIKYNLINISPMLFCYIEHWRNK